jgi:uncharacterized cupredoxin-like copper-binding protein
MMKVVALLTAATIALTACGQVGAASGPAKINVTEDEWHITMSQTSIPAGQVTFVLKNQGNLQHELVFLKTDVAQDKIAPSADEPGTVDESASIGEIEDVDAGQTKEATFDLKPGNYVLLCNKESHYESGMHVAFVVK